MINMNEVYSVMGQVNIIKKEKGRMTIKKRKPNRVKLVSADVELAVANYFGILTHAIIPNIFWSMFNYELDLLVLTKAGYASEIEIKVSKADLKKDTEKSHGHRSPKIKYLYFAFPAFLEPAIDLVPERAGILLVNDLLDERGNSNPHCKLLRPPKLQNNYKFTDKEAVKLGRLGTLRMWSLKGRMRDLKNRQRDLILANKQLKEQNTSGLCKSYNLLLH